MIVFIFIYTKKMINRLPRLKRYTFQKPKKKKKKKIVLIRYRYLI